MMDIRLPIFKLIDDITKTYNVQLYLLRTDLNHPFISGNKLFKLKYNLEEANRLNRKMILTFGGAFSNHIAATAAAGKEYGFNTIGIIRGEKYEELNPTLTFAEQCGMQLHYVSRALYQHKDELLNYVNEKFEQESIYMIPEGGSNELGVKGCEEIINYIQIDFDYVTVACGTGATCAGIVRSLNETQRAIGFQILKGEGYIQNEVQKWLRVDSKKQWEINEDYHFGGYAKIKKELLDFISWFQNQHQIPLDYVYTGKMMFGVYDMIRKGFFKEGQTIVAVHTGGLQGNKGFEGGGNGG